MTTPPASSTAPPGGDVRRWRVLAVAAVVVAVGLGAWAVLRSNEDLPADTSVAAGFARDMSVHHAQAVEMAEKIRDRSGDPALRLLARDIALTQQSQIGRMRGWLDVWGLPATGTGARMAWMGESVEGLMPGMVSREELQALGTAAVPAAEVSFLRLMVAHHRGGVAMAQAVRGRHVPDEVKRLAQGIVESQQSEIEILQQLLRDRGQAAVADAPSPHDEMGG